MTKIDDEVKAEIRACIADKKNSSKCIDKVLEDHDIPLEKKDDILISIIKNNAGGPAEGS